MNERKRRRLVDRGARLLITIGGVLILGGIIGMMVFIGNESLPLLRGARISAESGAPIPVDTAAGTLAGWNEYKDLVFTIDAAGTARVVRRADGTVLGEGSVPPGPTVAIPIDGAGRNWALGYTGGDTWIVGWDAAPAFTQEGRTYDPSIRLLGPLPTGDAPIQTLAAVEIEEGFAVAAWGGGDTLRIVQTREETNLLGERRSSVDTQVVTLPEGERPTALALEHQATRLYVGTEGGRVLSAQAAGAGSTPEWSRSEIFPGRAVTLLGFLNGGHTLVAGSEAGEVETWFQARSGGDNTRRLVLGQRYPRLGGRVLGLAASTRDRSFLVWDARGNAAFRHGTTGATRARFHLQGQGPWRLALAPRDDGILSTDARGEIRTFTLQNAHPEVSLSSLFRKVHYEGYPDAQHVWQSTGSTDEFEPKLGLAPLVFGTLKGAAYALLFSLPIAVLAAAYAALFMHPRLRDVVKPAMEMMAAMPSVVLGFLAGLWLAPSLQHAMPSALLLPPVLVGTVLIAGALWRRLPRRLVGRLWPGSEALVLIVALAIAIRWTLGANGVLDALFPGGFLDWLYKSWGVRYDQRNALVVGIAMGVAVIPIIFTISEDAISNVPRSLWAGSLALGASPWQTAWRVILPAASPGIFSAVMIGLGRAVGETMIVLMATGNTPIMDPLPWNGFRTLSANIAVEIPEAPQGGTLYRVLFLTALVLFVMTFLINTIAELVRQRLRRRYSRF